MRVLIAKTQEGVEFFHSKQNAYFCDRGRKHAEKIVDALNNNKYQLKEGEKWHIYDLEYTQEMYVTKKIYIATNGNIVTKGL